MLSLLNSITGILQQVNDQEIFRKIEQLDKMNKVDRDATIEQLSNSAVEELTSYFSKTLIEQMKSNPGIIPLLRSDRVGLQVGIPEARLTGDLLNKQLQEAYKNDMPLRVNLLNLISTLLYRSIVSEKDLNSLMPTLGENIEIFQQIFN